MRSTGSRDARRSLRNEPAVHEELDRPCASPVKSTASLPSSVLISVADAERDGNDVRGDAVGRQVDGVDAPVAVRVGDDRRCVVVDPILVLVSGNRDAEDGADVLAEARGADYPGVPDLVRRLVRESGQVEEVGEVLRVAWRRPCWSRGARSGREAFVHAGREGAGERGRSWWLSVPSVGSRLRSTRGSGTGRQGRRRSLCSPCRPCRLGAARRPAPWRPGRPWPCVLAGGSGGTGRGNRREGDGVEGHEELSGG